MKEKRLDIKYKETIDGVSVEKIRYSVEKWQADDKYMGESFITFTVKSSKPIGFYVGDYCEYRGETYTLNYVPSVSQRGNIGDSGDSFVYESVKMDSVREELGRIIMLDITPTTGDYVPSKETNYTGSARFQLYCGETSVNGKTRTPVCTLAGKIQANLDRAYPTKGWKVFVDTESTHEEAGEPILNTHSDEKVLTFDNTTVSAALAEVKNTFDIDYAIKGRTIYIGYTFGSITGSGDDYYYFGYGKGYLSEDNQGKALFELKRTADSNQKIVTRLRALGSTKNIPYRYYNKKYNLSQSMFPTNLQLPDTFETPAVKALHNAERKAMYPWIRDVLGETNDAYIDKNDNCLETVEGLREDCMRWDGSNPDLKEIYPSIEEVTYKDLRGALCEDMEGNKGSSSFVNYLDAERVDEILEVGDNANTGDGILPESNSTRETMSDAKVTLAANETQSSLSYMGIGYVSKEYTVMTIPSQYAGEYLISNSHLYFGASYSLGRHQSENITKTCGVAYKIKVYATPVGSGKESVICEYISDFKSISNRDEKEFETAVTHLPDSDAETPKVSKIELTTPSDIRIAFALVVNGLDYTYDQYTVSWRLGLPVYDTAGTDTEWTPALIWDLKGSASTLMKNPFQLYVKDMGFDFVAQFSTSDEPRIAMKTGMCVAREFKIGNNPERVKINKNGKTYNAWKLTLAKADDSGLKTYYPSENFPLAAGDKFVVLGIEMPGVYVEAASMKLLVEATKALADVCDTKHDYEPSVDDIYLQRNYDRCEEEGDVTKSVYWKLASGMKFPFFGIREKEDETPSTFTMIIDTLSIREGDGLTPKVTIKLSEDFQQNTIQKLTRTVESITKGSIFNSTSNMGGGMSESSVRAVVSDYTNSRFLSKINNDTAAGLITFLKGLVADGLITARQGVEFGEFISGYIGKGGRIDTNGHGELESLTLRSFLAVPVLRYNRISVTDGESWNTNGFGVIEEVDTENKVITLHLEDDEYASVEQGDICRGIFQDLDSEYSTADADADDCGFATKKGFFTSYFTVVRLISSGKGECRFEYALRNESTPQPCRMMKFAQYGSFTNEQRMSSCYSSAIVHFYSQVMEHVNTWEISPMMVSLRFGWLEGFPVTLKNGNVVRLKDHGLYVPGNVYFGQTITQLDAASIADLKKQLEQYTIEVATAVDVITVDDAGNVIGGLYSLDAEGKKTDYRLSSAVFVKRGNEYLTEADKGADASSGTYRIYAYCDGCECVVDNSTIYITSIKNIKDGIAGTEDDYTFDYDAMREMTGLTVTVVADCEGIGSISKDYHVTVKHDPKPFINFTMDNQIANISYNTKTQKYVGSPYKIRVSAYKDNAKLPIVAMNGDTEVRIMSVKLSSYEGLGSYGISYSWDKENNDIVLNVSVSSSNAASGRMLFTASYTYAGVSYEQSMVHSINIASDTNMYELMPSVSQVVAKTNQSGELVADTEKITCKVICNSSDDGQYVMTADELTTRKMSVKYSVGDDATLSECPSDGLSVLPEWSKIVFHLFFGDVEIDTQDVPIMLNGLDGEGYECVFILGKTEAIPDITFNADSEDYQKPDYLPTSTTEETEPKGKWTDNSLGIGANWPYEFYAIRRKKFGKWQAFETPKIWSRYAVDGENPYVIDLTNENSSVLCDDLGNALSEYEKTSLVIWRGTKNVTNEFDVGPENIKSDGITCTETDTPYTYSFSNITKDLASVTFTATKGSVTLVAVYTVARVRNGAVYSLVCNKSTVHLSADGTPTDSSNITISVKRTTPSGTETATTATELEGWGLTLQYLNNNGGYVSCNDAFSFAYNDVFGTRGYASFRIIDGNNIVVDSERINAVSDGNSITGTKVTYKVGASGTEEPSGDWQDNSPETTDETPYLWRKMEVTYLKGEPTVSIACIGKKGDRGIDGGGTEWIYFQSVSESIDWSTHEQNPEKYDAVNQDDYIPEKCPGWTDDSQGVSEEMPYEWISERKKKAGTWEKYSTPKIWARWAKDGIDGKPGENGNPGKNGKYSKVFYTWTKDDKPTAPTETGISVSEPPSPWCDTFERNMTYEYRPGWGKDGEYRVEPGIVVDADTEDAVTISSANRNQSVYLEVMIERPSELDYVHVKTLNEQGDKTLLAAAYGTDTVFTKINLDKMTESDSGEYWYNSAYIYYKREDSASTPRSCRYRVLPDENLKCWACNAVIDGDNDTIISWGDVVMYTCDTNKQESIYILSDCEDNDIPIPMSNAYKDKYVPRMITDIWSIDAQYSIGARVLLEYNGVWRRYKCKKSVPDIKPKDENSNYWVGYSGTPESHTDWSIEGLYSEGDYVLYEGHYYQCIKVIPNIRPYATESEFWTDARDWTDDPTGISEAFKFEYVSIRQKNNGVWGSYSKPVIWTKWAMDAEAVKGDPGYSLNPPVLYQAGVEYKFEKLPGTDIVVRDVVIREEGEISYYYMVKNRTDNGEKVTKDPAEDKSGEYWQKGSEYKLLIADALLAANANIGGFRIYNKKLVSVDDGANPAEDKANLVLDGVKGTIKAKNADIEGKIVATEGSFDKCAISETCEVRGRLKGVTGTFKKITALDENGNEGASLLFGEQRLTVDGHINQQGTTPDGDSLRFYSSHIWCRGSFGAYQLNTVLVEGNKAKYYYDGLHKNKYYEYNMASVVINDKTCYKLPLYSPGTGSVAAGFPVDMVLFKNSDLYRYYMFTDAVAGKMVHCINIADDYNNTFILGNSGYTQCGGGVAQTWFYAGGSNINPVNTNDGGGWLIMTQYDNNW